MTNPPPIPASDPSIPANDPIRNALGVSLLISSFGEDGDVDGGAVNVHVDVDVGGFLVTSVVK